MFESILTKVGAGILGLATFLAGLLGYAPVGTDLPSGTAVFETSLATGIQASSTSMTLNSASIRGGDTLSGYQCFTVDEGSAQAEFICGTASGTSITSLERGISPADGITSDSDLKFSHRRGASVKITNFPLLQRLKLQNAGSGTYTSTLSYASAVSIATSSNNIPYATWVQNAITTQSALLTTDQTIAGDKTFTGNSIFSGTTTISTSTITSLTLASGTISRAPTIGTDIANKTYVDGVAVAGASNADETTKGIVEEATAAEVIAYTATGGTGAELYVAPDKLDDFMQDAISVYYATSSATGEIGKTYSMTSNDILMVWIDQKMFDTSANCNTTVGGMKFTTTYRSNLDSATTTEIQVGTGAGANDVCVMTGFFSYTATTTETLNVNTAFTVNASDPVVNSYMSQLIKR